MSLLAEGSAASYCDLWGRRPNSDTWHSKYGQIRKHLIDITADSLHAPSRNLICVFVLIVLQPLGNNPVYSVQHLEKSLTMSTVTCPMLVLPYCCLKFLILVCSLGMRSDRTSFRFCRNTTFWKSAMQSIKHPVRQHNTFLQCGLIKQTLCKHLMMETDP